MERFQAKKKIALLSEKQMKARLRFAREIRKAESRGLRQFFIHIPLP